MKRLPTGLILLDTIDIVCISVSAGSSIAFLIRKYKKYKTRNGVDPIVIELKKKSPVTMVSETGKVLKLPLMRGGEDFLMRGGKGFSMMVKNKKLAAFMRVIANAKRTQKQLRFWRLVLFLLNSSLTSSVGLRFAVGGSLDYTQVLLIAFPSTIGGLIMGLVMANPLASVFLPLVIVYGRGIENIPDPSEKCKVICKVAEEFHNKQLGIEMKKLDSLVDDASAALQLPLDKAPLLCVEEKLSLLQRYKLREVIKSSKAKRRVQHFSEFIKKFPECNSSPEAVYEQVVEKIAE